MVNPQLTPAPTPTTDPADSKHVEVIFLKEKNSLDQLSQTCGDSKHREHVFLKKRPAATESDVWGVQNSGAIFLNNKTHAATWSDMLGLPEKKKNVCGNVVRHVGLPRLWGTFV